MGTSSISITGPSNTSLEMGGKESVTFDVSSTQEISEVDVSIAYELQPFLSVIQEELGALSASSDGSSDELTIAYYSESRTVQLTNSPSNLLQGRITVRAYDVRGGSDTNYFWVKLLPELVEEDADPADITGPDGEVLMMSGTKSVSFSATSSDEVTGFTSDLENLSIGDYMSEQNLMSQAGATTAGLILVLNQEPPALIEDQVQLTAVTSNGTNTTTSQTNRTVTIKPENSIAVSPTDFDIELNWTTNRSDVFQITSDFPFTDVTYQRLEFNPQPVDITIGQDMVAKVDSYSRRVTIFLTEAPQQDSSMGFRITAKDESGHSKVFTINVAISTAAVAM